MSQRNKTGSLLPVPNFESVSCLLTLQSPRLELHKSLHIEFDARRVARKPLRSKAWCLWREQNPQALTGCRF